MSELAFDRKPRRMTDPPQNQSKWLVGFEGVEVKFEMDPTRIAYFAREATWGDIMREPTEEEFRDTLNEVATGKVLSAAKRGPGFGFRIRASRVVMDQMLRLAEGSGGAGSGAGAQTTRDNDCRRFNIVVPETIENLLPNVPLEDESEKETEQAELHADVREYVKNARRLYGRLVDAGVPPQDARYIALPQGFQTQWMHVMDLRALEKLCEQRLCNGLTQHETDYLVRVIRDHVVAHYPEFDQMLRSSCEKAGQCASRTMLFPPCGAFGEYEDEPMALSLEYFDPDKHLYPPDQNSGMVMAQWDVERQKLEREHPTTQFCFAGPPQPLLGEIND